MTALRETDITFWLSEGAVLKKVTQGMRGRAAKHSFSAAGAAARIDGNPVSEGMCRRGRSLTYTPEIISQGVTVNTRRSRANGVRLVFVVVSIGILTTGCRAKPRAYDPPPDRHLLEDRWSGYYFDQVHAEFFVPLYSPSPQLNRDFSEPIEVVSATGERRATLSSPAVTSPNGALVTIDYSMSEEGVEEGQVTVELRWPRNDGPVAVGQSFESETRSAAFSFKQLRWFLKHSGRFEVDGDDPYYRLTQKGGDLNSTDKKHRIDVEIKGRGRDGDLKRRLDYAKPTELYKIVDEVWPGAG